MLHPQSSGPLLRTPRPLRASAGCGESGAQAHSANMRRACSVCPRRARVAQVPNFEEEKDITVRDALAMGCQKNTD